MLLLATVYAGPHPTCHIALLQMTKSTILAIMACMFFLATTMVMADGGDAGVDAVQPSVILNNAFGDDADEDAISRVVDLSDASFEHDTQASTGATTGDWLIEFYAPV